MISIPKQLLNGWAVHILKKEWVLDGAAVLYGRATELRAMLEYDFSEEKRFSYQNLSTDEIEKPGAKGCLQRDCGIYAAP